MAEQETVEHKYGIDDLAALMGLNAASVRSFLRKSGVERTGRSYGWDTKGELDAIVKDYQNGKKSPGRPKADEAPAPKAKVARKAAPEAAPVKTAKVTRKKAA
jgi:hypothetical protein